EDQAGRTDAVVEGGGDHVGHGPDAAGMTADTAGGHNRILAAEHAAGSEPIGRPQRLRSEPLGAHLPRPGARATRWGHAGRRVATQHFQPDLLGGDHIRQKPTGMSGASAHRRAGRMSFQAPNPRPAAMSRPNIQGLPKVAWLTGSVTGWLTGS